MNYGRLKIVAIASIVFYFSIGITAAFTSKIQEYYPVFSWSLFSTIPNPHDTYSILIHRVGDTEYDPALTFQGAHHLFAAIDQSPTQYTQPIMNLGSAMERGDAREIERQRSFIEKIFRDQPYRYSIMRVRLDPVEFYRAGTYVRERTIGSFESL